VCTAFRRRLHWHVSRSLDRTTQLNVTGVTYRHQVTGRTRQTEQSTRVVTAREKLRKADGQEWNQQGHISTNCEWRTALMTSRVCRNVLNMLLTDLRETCLYAIYLWYKIVIYVSYVTGDDIQCESKKNPPYGFLKIFPKRLGIFNQFLKNLLYDHFYTRVEIFIQISPPSTKLCHTKRDHLAKFYISLEL